jgi:PleD family two-component response regulator
MTINVSVPLEASPPAERQHESDGPARILVVDDVADNRDILTRRLVRRGFDVVEAGNGREALEVLARGEIDLVLLDIMMPDIEGTEIVREIRKTRSQTQLPIIMVSAKTLSEDVAESLELGANDYIIKPVDFTVALARIRAQLERKRAADELATKTMIEREELKRASEALEAESTKHRRSQDRLQYLAFHDDLTGLMNRVAFRDATERALAGNCKHRKRMSEPAL